MQFYPDPYMVEEAIMMLVPVFTSVVPSILLGIASYVLTSMALYTLAARRELGHAWLSWVPVLNLWIVGSLSDQYRYVVKGQNKSKRKILLLLNLIALVLGIVILVISLAMAADLISSSLYGLDERRLLHAILGPVLSVAGLSIPLFGVTIAAAVVRFMALYDIYQSMDPFNSVMFLVLSILFGVTEPFFLFFNRDKDGGMPPRKQEPVYEAPQQPKWPPREPVPEFWEEENKDYL